MAEDKYIPATDKPNAEKERQRLIETFKDLPQEVNDMYAGLFSILGGPILCRICYAREQKAKEEEG